MADIRYRDPGRGQSPTRSWRGGRRYLLLAILTAGILAAWGLGLRPSQLLIGPERLKICTAFARAALTPAMNYEAHSVPPGTPPFPLKVIAALGATIKYAAAAVSLSLVGGALLGFLGSSSWWPPRRGPGRGGSEHRILQSTALPALNASARFVMAVLRSMHEFIWALVFLAAFGYTPMVAVAAIAIPYCGTFGKVFSEILDESPLGTRNVLLASGAHPVPAFLFGVLPQALPDLLSYALYRFECALRSSAVLGFVGLPTLGYYLRLSFDNSHYREVWAYLYALMAIVIVFDVWGASIRKRLTNASAR